MKLESKGQTIMVLAMLLMLAGCKQKSGMDILNDRMSGLKALKSQYVVHREGETDVVVNVIYSQPNRILITSENFVVGLNEKDGHFESLYSEKTYDLMPWSGQIYPGTGKLVSRDMVNAGPASANPPNKIVPGAPWKLESKNGDVERYTKTVKGMDGPQTFKLEVTDKGVPVKFISSSDISYIVKSFELVDEIPLEKFRVEPKEGFVSHRVASDSITMASGTKFSWSKFKPANDVNGFQLGGNTMFVFVDPREATSMNASNWIKTPGQGFKKVTISKGTATSGFFDPTGEEFSKLTTTTPAFVMVDKDSKIMGMWLGFDQDNIAEFEKDIQAALHQKP